MSWRKNQARDPFFRKAKEDNYRSRAAYKLLEIQQKFQLISRGSTVLDLGCAPGGWLQVARKLTDAQVYGIDLEEIRPIYGIKFAQFDFFDQEALDEFLPNKIEVILSDLSPKISGDRLGEHLQSIQMLIRCSELAIQKEAKWLVFKLLEGGRSKETLLLLNKSWKICIFKPTASRSESREIYVVAKRL